MKLELYKEAVLTCDVPEHRLLRGDIVKIEVFNALGDTIAVTAVPASSLETLREDEILCARSLASQ